MFSMSIQLRRHLQQQYVLSSCAVQLHVLVQVNSEETAVCGWETMWYTACNWMTTCANCCSFNRQISNEKDIQNGYQNVVHYIFQRMLHW